MPLARIRPMWVLVDWSHVCFQFWKYIGVLVDWSVVTYEFLVLYLHIDVLMDWSNACLQYCKHIDVLMDWPKHFLLCRSYHYIMRTTTNQPWDSLSLEWHQNITNLSVQLLCFTIICNDLGYLEPFFSSRLASLANIGSANVTRDGLVSGKRGVQTTMQIQMQTQIQIWMQTYIIKNTNTKIQATESNVWTAMAHSAPCLVSKLR